MHRVARVHCKGALPETERPHVSTLTHLLPSLSRNGSLFGRCSRLILIWRLPQCRDVGGVGWLDLPVGQRAHRRREVDQRPGEAAPVAS